MKKIITLVATLAFVSTTFATNSAIKQYRQGDYQKASKGIQQLASRNHAVALYSQGMMYLNGYGQPKSISKGIGSMTKSARKGYLKAQLFLAKYYLQEKKDPEKALYWFKQAAAKGNLDAQMYTAAAYLYGYGTKASREKARRLIIKAAQSGNAIAQFNLAQRFLKSRHRGENRLGKMWLNRSAKQGNTQAEALLAQINLNHGRYIKSKDPTVAYEGSPESKAMQWLTAGQNKTTNIPAYTLKGDWFARKHEEGYRQLSSKKTPVLREQIFTESTKITDPNQLKISDFIHVVAAMNYQLKKPHLFIPQYQLPKDEAPEALFKRLSNEAHHGYARSQFMLGQLYEHGIGTEKNIEQAIYWYQKSEEQGYLRAEYALGILYLEGNGVPKNYKKAVGFLQSAAFKGNTYSQYLLGLINEYGLGQPGSKNFIPRDLKYAAGMYHLSAGHGYPRAEFNLAELYTSGLLGKPHTVKEQTALHKLILELYENAAEAKVPQAKLALAYYYLEGQNKDKQKWAFKVADEAADENNPYATFLLGLMYDRGVGVSQSRGRAISYYQKSAKAGNPVADFILGTYYYLGEGVSGNKDKALRLLQKAAQNDLPYANYNLALIQYNDNPHSHFLPLMQKAARGNFAKADLFLANYYLNQSDNLFQLKDAANIYLKLAKLGHARAQMKLAYMYENGIYFRKNPREARKWYQQAAEQNNPMAQYLLGNMYQLGSLGKPDLTKAKIWYEKAGDQGLVAANVALAFILENHDHQYEKAFELYKTAAKAGNPQAEYNLAVMYNRGKGTKVNQHKAYKWYLKSSNQNYAPAQYGLAMIFLKGQKGQQCGLLNTFFPGLTLREEDKRAVKLLKSASKQDNLYATYQLGLLYESGVGTPMDLEKAASYYERAANKGSQQAKLALARLHHLGVANHGEKKPLPKSLSIMAENLPSPSKVENANCSPNQAYMYAINDLNSGKTRDSVSILRHVQKQFPKFEPAKLTLDTLIIKKKPEAAAPVVASEKKDAPA